MSYGREKFEQAVKDQWSDSFNFKRGIDSFYLDETLAGMWWGWRVSRRVLSSRQELEGEPVAWWDGDMSAAEDSFSFKLNRCYTIPLYTHPARGHRSTLGQRKAAQVGTTIGVLAQNKEGRVCAVTDLGRCTWLREDVTGAGDRVHNCQLSRAIDGTCMSCGSKQEQGQ